MFDLDRDEKIIVGFCALLVLVVIAVGILAAREQNAWEAWCQEQGGRVVTDTDTNVGVSTDGKPVVVTDSTSYCLTGDGRIIDVR